MCAYGVNPLTVTMKVHFTDPMRPLVLFAGIRRKNEIIGIFLYSLFLVGTGTGEEKRTHGYEQNSIFWSRNERVAIAEFAALWFRLPFNSFSTQHTVLCRDLPFGGAHSFGAAQTLNALYVSHGMKRKEGRLMLKRFMRWILPLVVLVLIATYFVLSPMVAGHAAGPNVPATHTIAPQFLLPDFFIRH